MAGRILDGSDVLLFLGASPVLVGCATEVNLTVNRETRDVRCKATGKWSEAVKGLITWSITLSGVSKVYTESEKTAGNIGYDDLFEDLVLDTTMPMKYGSTTVGDPQFSGNVLTVSWEFAGGDGESTYNVTLQGSGVLTKTTVAA